MQSSTCKLTMHTDLCKMNKLEELLSDATGNLLPYYPEHATDISGQKTKKTKLSNQSTCQCSCCITMQLALFSKRVVLLCASALAWYVAVADFMYLRGSMCHPCPPWLKLIMWQGRASVWELLNDQIVRKQGKKNNKEQIRVRNLTKQWQIH